jgi:hypothetical protein
MPAVVAIYLLEKLMSFILAFDMLRKNMWLNGYTVPYVEE